MSYVKANALLAFIGFCIYDGRSGTFKHVQITNTHTREVFDFHGEFVPHQRHDPFKDYEDKVKLHWRSYFGKGSTFEYEGGLQEPGKGSNYDQVKFQSNHSKVSRIIHGTRNNREFEVEVESDGKHLLLKEHFRTPVGEWFRFYLSDVF